ncbi:MAG TPA: glycerophosphodiester phosphodiesterase family protein [Thermomicrobiales bacterium]|nr:glycerophosphodiester phosphodiesterase family protein [Thermomicrobiales bacterium]
MLNIAHRGASGYAPENTRAAFELAITMGADMIETDVQLTSDGELVLIHDTTVSRTSNGRGPVGDYQLDELRALDIGRWYGDGFAGERILTLNELILEFLPRIPFVLEIKDPRAAPALVDAIAAAGISERVHVTSFFWPALLDAHVLDPSLTLGFLTRTFDSDIIRRSVARQFAQICPHVQSLTTDLVTEAHEVGLIVRALGINERVEIDRLFATGADGATVNWPDWLPGQIATDGGSPAQVKTPTSGGV